MKAEARSHVEISVTVMDLMKAPEQGPLVFEDVANISGQVQEQDAGDDREG